MLARLGLLSLLAGGGALFYLHNLLTTPVTAENFDLRAEVYCQLYDRFGSTALELRLQPGVCACAAQTLARSSGKAGAAKTLDLMRRGASHKLGLEKAPADFAGEFSRRLQSERQGLTAIALRCGRDKPAPSPPPPRPEASPPLPPKRS